MTRPFTTVPQDAATALNGRMKAGLIAFVVLCSVLQWTVGRAIETQKVFDSRHADIAHNFQLFTAALQEEVLRDCASGSIDRIYFDNLDVGLVYFVNAANRNPDCKPIRETNLTPIAPASLAQCSVIIVKETDLSWWTPGLAHAELGPVAPLVSQRRKWSSPDGDFGFDVYRKSGCPTLGRGRPE